MAPGQLRKRVNKCHPPVLQKETNAFTVPVYGNQKPARPTAPHASPWIPATRNGPATASTRNQCQRWPLLWQWAQALREKDGNGNQKHTCFRQGVRPLLMQLPCTTANCTRHPIITIMLRPLSLLIIIIIIIIAVAVFRVLRVCSGGAHIYMSNFLFWGVTRRSFFPTCLCYMHRHVRTARRGYA